MANTERRKRPTDPTFEHVNGRTKLQECLTEQICRNRGKAVIQQIMADADGVSLDLKFPTGIKGKLELLRLFGDNKLELALNGPVLQINIDLTDHFVDDGGVRIESQLRTVDVELDHPVAIKKTEIVIDPDNGEHKFSLSLRDNDDITMASVISGKGFPTVILTIEGELTHTYNLHSDEQ